ncbi:hypothetical protein ABPG74_015927 [Tetrahymena malaccensis]
MRDQFNTLKSSQLLEQNMKENELHITKLQMTQGQIQNYNYNIKGLFDVEFCGNIKNDKEIQVRNKQISKIITKQLLISNMFNENLINNIQNVKYNKYTLQKGVDFIESDNPTLYCDNLIFFYLLPTQSLQNGKELEGTTQFRNKQLREICSQYNICNNYVMDIKHLRKPQSLDNNLGFEKKKILNILGSKPFLKEQYLKNNFYQGFKHYETSISYYVMKIECQNIDFDQLISNLNRAQKDLNEKGFCLFQIDITQDFLGTFDKQETIQYLLKSQKCKYKDDCDNINVYNNKAMILDNDQSFGQNCLSYLTCRYGYQTRHKIYDKFVCQLTSTSVLKKCFNNHFIDIFYSNTYNLRYSLQESQKYGLTRFEITVYNGEIFQKHNYINNQQDIKYELFKNSLNFIKHHQQINIKLQNNLKYDNI